MSSLAARLERLESFSVRLQNAMVNRAPAWLFSKTFIGANENRSDSDNGLYIMAVERAVRNYKAFTRFKRNAHYRAILEHATERQGQNYLDIIRHESPDMLERIGEFLTNDLIGSPIRYRYNGIGLASPTTLRYMKVASDIHSLFGTLDGAHVAEIGIGYGGQCLTLDKVCALGTYEFFDLPPVLQLTSKYLEAHTLRCSYALSTLNQCASHKSFDLVISNYAFSELPAPVELRYIDKVLARAKRGYLTMNSGRGNGVRNAGKLSLEQLKKLLPAFDVIEEVPRTDSNNYIIVWGHDPHSRVLRPSSV